MSGGEIQSPVKAPLMNTRSRNQILTNILNQISKGRRCPILSTNPKMSGRHQIQRTGNRSGMPSRGSCIIDVLHQALVPLALVHQACRAPSSPCIVVGTCITPPVLLPVAIPAAGIILRILCQASVPPFPTLCISRRIRALGQTATYRKSVARTPRPKQAWSLQRMSALLPPSLILPPCHLRVRSTSRLPMSEGEVTRFKDHHTRPSTLSPGCLWTL